MGNLITNIFDLFSSAKWKFLQGGTNIFSEGDTINSLPLLLTKFEIESASQLKVLPDLVIISENDFYQFKQFIQISSRKLDFEVRRAKPSLVVNPYAWANPNPENKQCVFCTTTPCNSYAFLGQASVFDQITSTKWDNSGIENYPPLLLSVKKRKYHLFIIKKDEKFDDINGFNIYINFNKKKYLIFVNAFTNGGDGMILLDMQDHP